jgi:hypothetical protein
MFLSTDFTSGESSGRRTDCSDEARDMSCLNVVPSSVLFFRLKHTPSFGLVLGHTQL